MSKKTFKDNPALRFISTSEKQEPIKAIEKSLKKTEKVKTSKIKEYKLNPMYVETRSKRFNMLMQPSLFSSLQAKAKEKSISVNELSHQILQEYMKGE